MKLQAVTLEMLLTPVRIIAVIYFAQISYSSAEVILLRGN